MNDARNHFLWYCEWKGPSIEYIVEVIWKPKNINLFHFQIYHKGFFHFQRREHASFIFFLKSFWYSFLYNFALQFTMWSYETRTTHSNLNKSTGVLKWMQISSTNTVSLLLRMALWHLVTMKGEMIWIETEFTLWFT